MDAGAVHGVVLVVDDNAENRALAQATLEDEGYRVLLAGGGEEGIAVFDRERPDCVLLDIRMPGIDGITACQRMRQLPDAAEIPILFFTAQRDVETFDRAHDAGGDDYITKPVRPTELVTRVAAAVKLRRMAIERSDLYEIARRQRDDLQRMQLQREQLSAFLVHDLKNPVNSIDLHAQRILRDPQASERSRDAAAKVQEESRALLRMITNLLDLAKADAGQLVPQRTRIALRVLVDEVAAAMRVRAQAAGVTIDVAIPEATALTADPDLMRRVVENLVDNAIRHAPEDTAIRIEASDSADGIELRVADAGPGVPAEQREQVFERFVQAGASGRSNRGLGLSFCKLVVTTHHGRIWIEDASPGAVFCVWIPHDLQ